MENMTELTKKLYDQAQKLQTVDQAAGLLLENGQFRTLGDILRFWAGADNPKKILVDGLAANHPTISRDSADKKVRNWLNGRTQTVAKADAFELALILHLTLDQTDAFLKQVTGEGIHWRSTEDIVWSYGIFRGLDYNRIQELMIRAKALGKQKKTVQPDVMTAEIEQKLSPMLYWEEDAFLQGLASLQPFFGDCHNTAYRLFRQYIEILESAEADDFMDDGAKMTTRYILENYLYRNQVPVAKRQNAKEQNAFNAIQRSIRANWPDEQTLSKMKSRELDVPRKVLIMLFLATDGGERETEEDWDDYDDDLDYEEEILTRDEVFQSVYIRLNRMLRSCGFRELDPRSPFDWIVLFSICVDDLWDMEIRFREMLSRVFPDGTEKQ